MQTVCINKLLEEINITNISFASLNNTGKSQITCTYYFNSYLDKDKYSKHINDLYLEFQNELMDNTDFVVNEEESKRIINRYIVMLEACRKNFYTDVNCSNILYKKHINYSGKGLTNTHNYHPPQEIKESISSFFSIQYCFINQALDFLGFLNDKKNRIDEDVEEIKKEEIKDKEAESDPIADEKRIFWLKDNNFYFILFSCLYEEKFIRTSYNENSNDEYRIALILYKLFDLSCKSKKRKNYTFKSFYQMLKKSGDLQSNKNSNVLLKRKIKTLLQNI